MSKIYCRNCYERLAWRGEHLELYSFVEYIDKRVCPATEGHHAAR